MSTRACGCGSVSHFACGAQSGRCEAASAIEARDIKSARLAFRNQVRAACDSGLLPGCVPRVFCVHGACAQELVKLQVVDGRRVVAFVDARSSVASQMESIASRAAVFARASRETCPPMRRKAKDRPSVWTLDQRARAGRQLVGEGYPPWFLSTAANQSP